MAMPDGQLLVDLGVFVPNNLDKFTVISATSVSGTFDNVASNRVDVLGGGSFLVTVTLSNVELSDYQPSALAAATSTGALTGALIDAAIAYDMANESSVTEATPPVEPPNFVETATDRALASRSFSPAVLDDANFDLATTAEETEAAEDTWLADELLERVFG